MRLTAAEKKRAALRRAEAALHTAALFVRVTDTLGDAVGGHAAQLAALPTPAALDLAIFGIDFDPHASVPTGRHVIAGVGKLIRSALKYGEAHHAIYKPRKRKRKARPPATRAGASTKPAPPTAAPSMGAHGPDELRRAVRELQKEWGGVWGVPE